MGAMARCCKAAARKGTARSYDHGLIVHDIWTQALLNRSYLWIERVCSKDNISDLPSREEHKLLQEIGAVWRPPMISKAYMEDLLVPPVCS